MLCAGLHFAYILAVLSRDGERHDTIYQEINKKTPMTTNVTSLKKLYIKTYGCQMNVYDSERMADLMRPLGYLPIDTPNDANLIVLNTCHIREKAAEKVYSELGRLRPLKEEKQESGEEMFIAVAGCVGQAEGEEIFRRAPYVDMVCGPQTYHQLPDLVAQVRRQQQPQLALDFVTEEKFDHLPMDESRRQSQAFVTIQEGCDKFCTFCVVPYTRGAEYSRPVDEVIKEVKQVVANGALEVTLLGQNVNAYHGMGRNKQEWGLGRLILELAEIEGLKRIRYTTSHPRDMDAELIRAHGDVEALMPYLHLPVQSGSDAVLKRMNRKHTADFYRRIIDQLRAVRPDIAFSSDFIVGFPGESEEDFEQTMQLVRDVHYAQAYSFKYSVRPGTPAAEQADQVPESTKSARLHALQELLGEQQHQFNQQMTGRILPVLVEKPGRHEGQVIGRSPYMQAVTLNADPEVVGTILDVQVMHVNPHSLTGVIADNTHLSSSHMSIEQQHAGV